MASGPKWLVSPFRSAAGVDFKTKIVPVGSKRYKLQLWDTAGQERYNTIRKGFYRGAKVIAGEGGGGGGGRGDIQILGVLCDGGARHFFSAAGHRIGVRHYHPRKLQEPEEMGERHHRGESCRVSWRKEVHASSPGP